MAESSRAEEIHELKSDLTVISGYTQLILRECRKVTPDLDRIGGYADMLLQMVRRQNQTIDRLDAGVKTGDDLP